MYVIPSLECTYLMTFDLDLDLKHHLDGAPGDRWVTVWWGTDHFPISAKILGCSPWSRSVLLGSAESEHSKLTNHEIIFEDFQPMWSRYHNVTDGQTDDLP